MNPLQQLELGDVVEISDGFEQETRFEITDLESLNWVFRKISAIKAKEAEIQSLAAAEKQRIDDWENRELLSIHNDLNYFESLVSQYHAQRLLDDPKQKTLSTPYGKSKSRATKAAPKQVDKDALLAHVKEAGMTEFIKEEVKWGDLKKSLHIFETDSDVLIIDANGQVVPGVGIEPASISFKVEV